MRDESCAGPTPGSLAGMERLYVIDLHSHILPELDDGSQSLNESLAMARMAVEGGIREMAATPHCMEGRAREVRFAWELLSEALQETGIPLKLYPGMEIFGTEDTVRLLKAGKLITLNGSRYPLVEFGFHSSGEEETEILRELVEAGYVPVVAHPERYAYLQQNFELVNEWKKLGCVFQVNRGSLLGRFSRSAQVLAEAMVERRFADVVATDAHSPRMRTPRLRDVRERLGSGFSPETARRLLEENPKRILNNELLTPAEPEWF